MEKLRLMLKKIIEEEANLESIEIESESLDTALEEACSKLNVTLSELDYEILESGDNGIFGFGKKKYKIRVYKARNTLDILEMSESSSIGDMDISLEDTLQSKDGEAFVRITEEGVLLKVIAPVKDGLPVDIQEVCQKLEARGFDKYEESVLNEIINKAEGEYIKIGSMPLNVVNDSTANVQISETKMRAYIIISAPRPGGYDLDVDQIRSILKSHNVIVGIKEDVIDKILDYPEYDTPIWIAEGIKVVNGVDASITYHFNTSKKKEFHEQNNGQIDFKSMNNIQNVTAGQILATKNLATTGEPGRTVTGEIIYNKPGKDLVLQEGKNTKVSDDGLNIVALTNGQVNYSAGKVNVDEVYIVQGDVNLKTGHISFLGNVIVTGSVEDNFNITAEGNIEIKGSVGKCRLEAKGNITVSQGIMGKDEAYIKAGECLYAKFIQQVSKVEVGDSVYVQDAIMQSYVDATKEICCVGKRATIVGGDLRAGETIKSGTIGSQSGTETIIEVGIDPKKRQELMEALAEQEAAYKELEEVQVNFSGLQNLKKQMRDKFPKEKEEIYKNLSEEINRLNDVIAKMEVVIGELNQYLAMLKGKGSVIATKIVYPQVKIYIKNSMLPIRTEYKKIQFILEHEEVNAVQYIEEKKDDEKR
ncbi:MAG: FapA family protein [Spirochaetales bacterium]|nr:FapA family protein [Spirochaetales bacterium]